VDGLHLSRARGGRCGFRDVLIIAPSCRIPVARYQDELGRFWFLSRPWRSRCSDAGALLPRLHFPAGHHRAGRLVPNNVFGVSADL